MLVVDQRAGVFSIQGAPQVATLKAIDDQNFMNAARLSQCV